MSDTCNNLFSHEKNKCFLDWQHPLMVVLLLSCPFIHLNFCLFPSDPFKKKKKGGCIAKPVIKINKPFTGSILIKNSMT